MQHQWLQEQHRRLGLVPVQQGLQAHALNQGRPANAGARGGGGGAAGRAAPAPYGGVPLSRSMHMALDPQHAARLAHNFDVRNEVQRRELVRALYLKQHLDKLRTFVTPAVAMTIEAKAAHAPTDYTLPEPVQEQPACIKGEMREYQVAGLQWLVKCYDHGINAILADEVGEEEEWGGGRSWAGEAVGRERRGGVEGWRRRRRRFCVSFSAAQPQVSARSLGGSHVLVRARRWAWARRCRPSPSW